MRAAMRANMLDILTILVGGCSSALYINGFLETRGLPHALTRIATYRWKADGAEIGMISAYGQCFARGEVTRCVDLDVGHCLNFFLRTIVLYHIFFGLAAFSCLAMEGFHWSTQGIKGSRCATKELRACILALLAITTMGGAVVGVGGLILFVVLPLRGRGLGPHLDVKIGFGQFAVILMTLGLGLLTLGFFNHSRRIIDHLDGEIRLQERQEDGRDTWDEKARSSDISELVVMG